MKTPADFAPHFTDYRLTTIAQALLEQCYTTDDDLQSPYDTNYGRGTTRFDRQRQLFLEMAGSHEWLNVNNSGLDLVMNINETPFRFLSDDPDAPRKHFATSSSSDAEAEQMKKHLEDAQHKQTELPIAHIPPGEPRAWRFFVVSEEDADGNREYDIKFIGFDEHKKIACVWSLADRTSAGYVAPVDGDIAPAVPTPPARTTLPGADQKTSKSRRQKKQ